MSTYTVQLPLAGVITLEVEADSEKEAIAAALASDWSTEDIDECDVYEYLVRGNVVYVPVWQARATKFDDDE